MQCRCNYMQLHCMQLHPHATTCNYMRLHATTYNYIENRHYASLPKSRLIDLIHSYLNKYDDIHSVASLKTGLNTTYIKTCTKKSET